MISTGQPMISTGQPMISTGQPMISTGHPMITTGHPMMMTTNQVGTHPMLASGSYMHMAPTSHLPLTIPTTNSPNHAVLTRGTLNDPPSPSSPGSVTSSQLDLEQTGSQRLGPTFKDGLKTYKPKDLIPSHKQLYKFFKWREYTIIFFALTSIILGAIKLYVFYQVYNELYGYLVFIDINVAIFFIGNVFLLPFPFFILELLLN